MEFLSELNLTATTLISLGLIFGFGGILWYFMQGGLYPQPFSHIPIVHLDFNPNQASLADDVLLLFRERGPVFQFLYHGKYALCISDPKLVKSCIEEMNDYEHDDDIISINICRMVFGGNHNTMHEKIKRHRLHLMVWSGEKLRHWGDLVVQEQLRRLCSLLDTFVDEEQRFDVKSLLGRFVLDLLYRECFEMNFNFIENVASYQEFMDALQFMQKVVSASDFGTSIFSFQHFIYLLGADARRHRAVIVQQMKRILDHLQLKQFNHTFEGESWGKYMMNIATEDRIDINSILFEILLIIVKGHGLTTMTLVGIIYGLVTNATMQTKCGQLVIQHSTLKIKSPKLSTTVLPDYVEGIIKESLRRFALNNQYLVKTISGRDDAFVFHLQHLNEDDTLLLQRDPIIGSRYPDVLQIPDGTKIFVSLGCLHNDERNWGKTSLEFQPKRWMTNGAFNSVGAYSGLGFLSNEVCFLPFSMGLRKCGGMAPALLQIRSFVYTIFRQYHFHVDEDPTEDNVLTPLQIKSFVVQAFYN